MNRSYRAWASVLLMVVVSLPVLEGGSAARPPRRIPSIQAVEGASVPDWNHLPYLRYSNGWFRVLSNHETFGGVEISSNTTITPNTPDPTPEEYAGINLEALWAAKCKAVDAQTMRLSRKVFFPGVPDTLQISQWAYGSNGKHPLKSITVKVNNIAVHHAVGAAVQTSANRSVIDLPQGAGESFKYGENTVTLIAVKRETKRKAAFCTTNKFGAAFELAGTFRADVSSTIPHGSATTQAAFLPMTITNNGPSHLPAGTYPCQVPVEGGGTQAGDCGYPTMFLYAISDPPKVQSIFGFNGAPPGATPREDCYSGSYSGGSRSGKILNCGLPPLAPGESLTIHIGVGYSEVTAGQIIYFGYGAPGLAETTETNTNNGEHGREIKEGGT